MTRRAGGPWSWPRILSLALGAFVSAWPFAFVTAAGAAPPDRHDQDLQQPELLNEVEVRYPDELGRLERPPAGRVVVAFVVTTQGAVVEVEVVESVHPRLDALVVDAVQSLRYEPGRFRGQAVEVKLSIAVDMRPPQVPEAQDGDPDPSDEGPVPAPTPSDVGDSVFAGQLRRSGDRTPIGGATVLVLPAPEDAVAGKVRGTRYLGDEQDPQWSRRAETDEDGNFEISELPAGKVRVVVTLPGHERLEQVEALGPSERLEVRYHLRRDATTPYRTVVEVQSEAREEVSRRVLDPTQIESLPGSRGDSMLALQSLPGVARAPFGLGLVVVRGSAPFDSAIYVGDHAIPVLFHFGALATAVSSDVLEAVEFVPSNYDAQWGNAAGGVVHLRPRKGRRDGFHGKAKLDLIDGSLVAEGPVGKGSFLVAGRRSVVDIVLPAVIPDDAGIGLVRAPRYYDYQAFFDYPVGKGGEISVRGFGADDRFIFVNEAPNDDETSDRNRTASAALFHRIDVAYRHRHGPWSVTLTPSFRHELGGGSNRDAFRFEIVRDVATWRAEVGRKLGRMASLRVGTEGVAGWFTVDGISPPVVDPLALPTGGPSEAQDTRESTGVVSLYASAVIGEGTRFRFMPGVRLDRFMEPMQRTTVDPRLRAAFDITDRTQLRAGAGIYSQTPLLNELSTVFGNRNLRPLRAGHFSAEVEHRFAYEITVTGALFYKPMWDLVVPSDLLTGEPAAPSRERLVNGGQGRAYGGELLVKKGLTQSLLAWVSYTLMWSERRDGASMPWYRFDYDQRHILSAVAVAMLPRGWRLGGRLRLSSGNPVTPVTGSVFDASSGNYLPIEGPRNSERLPLFHQFDARLEKRWEWRWGGASAWLDVQNVYNHANTEFWVYSADFSQRAPVTGLPILPSAGVQLTW